MNPIKVIEQALDSFEEHIKTTQTLASDVGH